MTGIEDALRDTLNDPPVEVAPPADPVARLDGLLRRRARRRLAASGTVLAVVAVLATTTVYAHRPDPAGRPVTGGQPTADVPPPAAVLSRAREIAASAASSGRSRLDDPVEWVATTRGAATRVSGLRTDGDPADRVYVIQLHGYFCCIPMPSKPAPGQVPSYRVFWEILPAAGLGPDVIAGPGGLGGDGLDLTRLGTRHTFPAP